MRVSATESAAPSIQVILDACLLRLVTRFVTLLHPPARLCSTTVPVFAVVFNSLSGPQPIAEVCQTFVSRKYKIDLVNM